MDAETVIQQFEKLSPEEKRKFRARFSERQGDKEGASADFDELVSEGVLEKRDDLWVITGQVNDTGGLVAKERERRMQELTGE